MSDKPRILFVDDEINILGGIRRMLSHKRSLWEIATAAGGAEALELMAQKPFDVVVSDMRMPGMNGAELLHRVASRYPDTIRFVLSGQSNEEETLRVIGTSHQYLSKPCEANTLEDRLERSLRVRNVLRSGHVRALVSKLTGVPSLPKTYAALLAEFQSAQTSDKRIDEIIAGDPALSSRLLGIVNSGYFGAMQNVLRPSQAVFFLGYDTVRALALASGILSQMKRDRAGPILAQEVIDHSLSAQALAGPIAELSGLSGRSIEESRTAALLHDLGLLVMIDNFPEAYSNLPRDGFTENDLYDLELEVFGAGHPEIGGYLLAAWGLPHWIVESALSHHHPMEAGMSAVNPVTVVHLACGLLQHFGPAGASGEPQRPMFDLEYVAALELSDRLPALADLRRALTSRIQAGKTT